MMLEQRDSRLSALRVPLLLSILTIVMVAIVEMKHPYFFLEDDNRDQFLPLFVHNFRALSHGEIPFFNFHQFLGTPALASLQSAALYPIGYLALLLSKLCLGHFFATIEFLALSHLVMAVVGFFYLARLFDLQEASCCFGAIAWAFCGYVMSVGNSWIWMIEYAAYLPWILYLSIRQMQGFSLSGFSTLLALRVMAFFLGQPQFYLYTVFFDSVTVFSLYFFAPQGTESPAEQGLPATQTVAPRTGSRKVLLTYAANHILALIIAAPILLPGLHHASESAARSQLLPYDQYAANSNDMGQWLNGLLFPFAHLGECVSCFNLYFISHLGYITLIMIVLVFATLKHNNKRRQIIIFAFIALFALLWADNTVVTEVFYAIPYFNRFRWPFKLMYFTSFYLILLSAFGADFFLTAMGWGRAQMGKRAVALVGGIMALHVANFLLLYGVLPQHSLGMHLDPVPFTEEGKEMFGDGRIFSIGFGFEADGQNVIHGYTAPLLGYNYATLFDLYHFAGYDAFLPQKNSEATFELNHSATFEIQPDATIPLDYLRLWGVKWYVVDSRLGRSNFPEFSLALSDEHRNIYLDPKAAPLVSYDGVQIDSKIPYTLSTNAIEIKTQATADRALRVNVLYSPFFAATVDGRKTPVTQAADEQMLVKVPGGSHTVIVRYSDPYFYRGVALSAIFLLAFIMAASTYSHRNRRSHRAEEGGNLS